MLEHVGQVPVGVVRLAADGLVGGEELVGHLHAGQAHQVAPAVADIAGRRPGAGVDPIHDPAGAAPAPKDVARVEVTVDEHRPVGRRSRRDDLGRPLPQPRAASAGRRAKRAAEPVGEAVTQAGWVDGVDGRRQHRKPVEVRHRHRSPGNERHQQRRYPIAHLGPGDVDGEQARCGQPGGGGEDQCVRLPPQGQRVVVEHERPDVAAQDHPGPTFQGQAVHRTGRRPSQPAGAHNPLPARRSTHPRAAAGTLTRLNSGGRDPR